MADVTRAEELVQTIEQDDAFRAEIEAAPTAVAKRSVLDAHAFQDVGLDEMRAYVERQGGTLVVQQGGHELNEQELAAVAGGLTSEAEIGIGVGVGVGIAATVIGGATVAATVGGVSAAAVAAAA